MKIPKEIQILAVTAQVFILVVDCLEQSSVSYIFFQSELVQNR